MSDINTDPVDAQSIIESFLSICGASGIAILGPDIDRFQARRNLYCWPSEYKAAAEILAETDVFGHEWNSNQSSLVAWIDTDRDEDWLWPWKSQNCKTLVRVAFDLPGSRAFEVYICTVQKLKPQEISDIVRAVTSSWPAIKANVLMPLAGLSPQQSRVLLHAFEGMTAKETAAAMGVVERTVIHHLAVAQDKLNAKNKLDSIRKAIWSGVL